MELSLNAYYEYEVLNVIPSLRNKKIKKKESLIGRINIEKELSLEEKSINLSLPKFMQETISEENKEVYLFNGNIYFGLYCPNENRLESHFIRGYLIKGIKESKEFAILSFLSSRNNPNYFENFWKFEKIGSEPIGPYTGNVEEINLKKFPKKYKDYLKMNFNSGNSYSINQLEISFP